MRRVLVSDSMPGDNKVDIARLQLNRDIQAKKALVILNTDFAIGNDVLEKLRKLPHVISIKPIKM